ncbi:Sporulation initiation phosphotransferase F [Moorella thermoacetica]|uniref:Stage 0 sporulation protein A homolog n=1 Tax=Neomoorella thermoacetica TaxID=1525 RepID=A0AAC9MW51_NEOTH|nr:response regulator [Moorella thermoacetica]AOQ25379.1 Sporulation initiation phosphotransferase F [Moorella thermoacetica]TYL11941.1 Sporulation initiation phosphotransferase F [Moorella thermoacetica]
MVIDDQPGVRRLIAEALKQAGFNVTVATDGQEALGEIALEEPSLVILDMKMPGMNGVEFLQELRRRFLALPVIVITAYNELDLVEQASKLGASYYLQKPFDLDDLYHLVRQALQPRYISHQAVG